MIARKLILPPNPEGVTFFCIYRLISGSEIMIHVLLLAIIFYYIAPRIITGMLFIYYYISEQYLYAIAQNVGYLKWFAGL